MTGILLTEQKKSIRLFINEQKKKLIASERKEYSEKIFEFLEQTDYFQKAHTVLCYWSMPDEVETHSYILNHLKDKEWLLPVVQNNQLEIRKFTGLEDLRQGVLHIEEPIGPPFEGEIDLAIIPGMAFDRHGNRLGRGKGYYDQFLSQHPSLKTVAVAFHFQLVDQVPKEKWDVPMNYIITERGVITSIL